ncbi:hypothetical protein ACU045_03920 [Microbacterium sp. MAHUQ-60]|uniref:hypothetical protein n=1 Tax=unclassified Microbacterium TaxID=2609290 RepID=UPI0036083630
MSDKTQAATDVSEDESKAARALGIPPELVAEKARELAKGDGFQAQIFKAIAVQRPVVLEYLRSVRRDKPHASPSDLLKELDSRYIATVTIASSGVGASAAIPGLGIPIALGLGVADLLFFYETSALYVLAVAELHGIPVDDPERAKPLVLGMLLGQKSQSEISKMVLTAFGAGGVAAARGAATGFAASSAKGGWGEVLTQQLPDSALAPLTIVIGREALKLGGKLGASTLGKAVPFGIGAVIGGVGSFTFGRDVVKASRTAFPETPQTFPGWLLEYEKPERSVAEPSRAALALEAAAGNAKDFGESVWGKVSAATEAFRAVDLDGDGIPDEARALTAVKRAGSGIAGTANKAADVFRSVDRDGDGVADEAQALTAVKDASNAVASAAGTARDKMSSLFKNRKKPTPDDAGATE